MARAALHWSLEEAAEAAESAAGRPCSSSGTVATSSRSIEAIRRACENAGVRFVEEADRIGLTMLAGRHASNRTARN